MIGFFEIYKYCSPYEKFIAYSGIFASIVAGFASPWSAVVMGEIITIFQPDASDEAVRDGIIYLLKMVAIISAVLWVCAYY